MWYRLARIHPDLADGHILNFKEKTTNASLYYPNTGWAKIKALTWAWTTPLISSTACYISKDTNTQIRERSSSTTLSSKSTPGEHNKKQC